MWAHETYESTCKLRLCILVLILLLITMILISAISVLARKRHEEHEIWNQTWDKS